MMREESFRGLNHASQNRRAIAAYSIAWREKISSRDSLGDVLGLSARSEVGSALSLVVGVHLCATSGVLNSLLCSAYDELLFTLFLFDLRGLVSDLTITGHRSVLLSHVLNF